MARSRSCSHCGEGPFDTPRISRPTKSGQASRGDVGGEIDRDRVGERARDRLELRGRCSAPEAASGEIAGDAGDAERVGAVRGDRDLDHRIEAGATST